MEFNHEFELFLTETWDKSSLSREAGEADATTQNIEKFFQKLEVQNALGDTGPAPTIERSQRVRIGDSVDDWDVWFSPIANDVPATGPGFYKRANGGRLVKVK